MSDMALKVEGLTIYLEGRTGMRRVVNKVQMTVPMGHIYALLGESGSGKTCIVQTILGLHPGVPGVVSGTAEVLGLNVLEKLPKYVELDESSTPTAIRKDMHGWNRTIRDVWAPMMGSKVTLIPQDATTALSPFHTVGCLLQKAISNSGKQLGREELRKEALNWLRRMEMYDVESVSNRYVHELSGGMAQRVAIALALASEPRIVIADEPTTGLDATLRIQLIALMASMVKNRKATLFLVTHDMDAARILANEVAVLYAGSVVESGPVEKILDPTYKPKHPYTWFLLESERRLLQGAEMFKGSRSISPPDEGCPYIIHCPRAIERCGAERPTLTPEGDEHQIACWVEGDYR